MYSNDLILDIVGSEQEYISPGYDEKDFRSFSEAKSGFGVKKVDYAASYRKLF